MTPIQQHEAELRAMMERAGLTVISDPGDQQITARNDTHTIMVFHVGGGGGWCTGNASHRTEPGLIDASHPDPRIALRHCLEMAGLLVDRPPVTDAELVRWLVERAGPCDFMDRWSYGGYTIRRLDSVWVFWHTDRPLERSIYARDLGAILWCGERWKVQS